MTAPVLEEAHRIIYGEREQTYGDPGKNLRVIADYWNTYLISKGFDFLEGLDYGDVCNMMVLMKVARLGTTPLHHDSLVDICGYTALADRVKEKRNAKVITSQTQVHGRVSEETGERRKAGRPKSRTTPRHSSGKSPRR